MSFVATSNQVKIGKVKGKTSDIQSILLESRTLKKAFDLEPDVDPEDVRAFARAQREEAKEKGPGEGKKVPVIIQHSGTLAQRSSEQSLYAEWGLVSTVVLAYNTHHQLVLRPDDFWQAILTQLSFYIQSRADALRDRIVDFQGQKTLVIQMGGCLFSADFGSFALQMADKIAENIKDPELAKWIIPSFTTSTSNDRIAASVTLMSTLQAYFDYVCLLRCGIPKVTLLGTLEDWQQLRRKIDGLTAFDLEDKLMTKWHGMLAPVLDHLVNSAAGQQELDFWDRVCHFKGGGSGPTYLSGWITVFVPFKAKGEWQGEVREGAEWPLIDTGKLPVGAVSVPVLVDDNGTQYDTQMIAGQVAHDVCGDGSILRPRTDWCIAYDGHPKVEPRGYRDGEIRPVAAEYPDEKMH